MYAVSVTVYLVFPDRSNLSVCAALYGGGYAPYAGERHRHGHRRRAGGLHVDGRDRLARLLIVVGEETMSSAMILVTGAGLALVAGDV